ncbi:hypothetical protein F5X96DRAFT_489636 [Biscogniauxia mediterranea]|nr:hypothetical protein F5X96DRAFT_489636 [Biscogniauxia mediterranea]
MTVSNTPRMPLAASPNATMTMSSVSSISQKSHDTAEDPSRLDQDVLKATNMQPQSSPSEDSDHVPTTLPSRASISGQSMTEGHRDKTRSKEQALVRQRIQLAEQLSSKYKICVDLEARVASLNEELASVASRNEALESECARLRGQIDEAVQQLESQTADAAQRDKSLLERVGELETKLKEATESLEQIVLSRDALQQMHHEFVMTCAQQTDHVQKLEHELAIGRAKLHDLTAEYDILEEKYNNDVTHTISNLEKSHESRERDLQQRLASKGTEAKELKKEISTVRAACADAVTKKEATQKLHTQVEDQLKQILQEVESLVKARDQSLAESQKLKQSLEEIEKSIEPFAQTVVIGVDVSGSLIANIHEVKQAYRDVLHMVKSVNSDAKVAVVIHGGDERHDPSPLQAISDTTFRILDNLDNTGGCEDYCFCLEEANDIFMMNIDSQKLLVLIGDGTAICSCTTSLFATCEQLVSIRVSTYSIIIQYNETFNLSMQDISDATNGRVGYKDTYLSVLDEVLRNERERHFAASQYS